MDFLFKDEQKMYKEMVRDFAQKEVLPYVIEYDREERYPIEIVQKMAALGLLGGVIPEQYGGAGIDYTTLALGIEEMSKVCIHMGSIMGRGSGLVGSAILKYGTEVQKQKYLIPLAKGERSGGAGVTEPHSGTDVAAMETIVRREGDHYVLNGSKTWISGVGFASWFLTFATLDKKAGPKGICAFIVDSDTPGFSTRPFKNKVGFRPSSVGELIFEDCLVPKENLVGKEGEGLRVAMCAVTNGRLSVAARAVGLSQTCLDASVKYAKERIVFGKPTATYQLVQAKIADMVVGTESARLLMYRLAFIKDQGIERARQEGAIAKYYSTEVALRSASDAVQIHGAYGCSEEYHVGRYFRDAKFLQIVEGQNDLQKVLIAEYALGYRQDRR
jgi:glutaryl-CoA dehydrogenase (non-decarboxylating)